MARPVTFVHAADLHLDAPFAGIDATDDSVRRELAEATYTALNRLVALCIESDADFLLLAGDVYNSRDKSLAAQFAFRRAMESLAEHDIPALVVQGNHDPADGWAVALDLPETVTIFSADSVSRVDLECGETKVAVYGQSFSTSAVKANLAKGFSRDSDVDIAIGLLHTNVGGRTEYEPYAPCSTEDLRAAGMDYWALGHIHAPGRVSDDPLALYAGSPQGLNPKERGEHGCYVVTIDRGVFSERFVELDSVRWGSVEISGQDFDSIDSLRSALIETAVAVRGEGDRPLVVRADVKGPCAVHSDLARPGAMTHLLTEVRDDLLAEEPWIWLDRLRNLTTPAMDIGRLREGGGFPADLVALADEVLADPDVLASWFDEALAPIAERARSVDPGLEASDALQRARDLCLERLLAGEDS